MVQVRVRPIFCDRTRPLDSSTCTCWTTAANDTSSGLASSLTDADPWLSRSTMRRRPGSASAWKIRSRCATWSSMCLSMPGARAIVKQTLQYLPPPLEPVPRPEHHVEQHRRHQHERDRGTEADNLAESPVRDVHAVEPGHERRNGDDRGPARHLLGDHVHPVGLDD